jgi:ribosomal-protein-alanine N-acetyltransferase
MPSEFSRPGYHLSRETRRVYERLIARRRALRIADVDDAGRPWVRARFRRPDGTWEHHALSVDHDGWVRVGAAVAVTLEKPTRRREAEFLAAARRSVRLHRRWGAAPSSPEEYRAYLQRIRRDTHEGFLVRRTDTGELAGVVNLNEIVRGGLKSAYLGYYAFTPHAGRGVMTEALRLAIDLAFSGMGLHRLEANIQPGNAASLRLVERLGFRREGYSPRYLKIGGRWRDHERWAILAEEWRPGRRGEHRRR